MKRKLPDTSIHALKNVTPEMLGGHYQKIVSTLQRIGTANYEQIAKYVGMDGSQVGRRLCELERMGVVYKPGTKSATKSGRGAYNYCLCITGEKVEKKTIPALLPGKTISEYSKEFIQPELF